MSKTPSPKTAEEARAARARMTVRELSKLAEWFAQEAENADEAGVTAHNMEDYIAASCWWAEGHAFHSAVNRIAARRAEIELANLALAPTLQTEDEK